MALVVVSSITVACDRQHSALTNSKKATRLSRILRDLSNRDIAQSLDLHIDHDFIDPQKQLIQAAPTQKMPPTILDNKSSDQRLRFKGRVFTNPDIENRLPGIEGGEVSLEMRF